MVASSRSGPEREKEAARLVSDSYKEYVRQGRNWLRRRCPLMPAARRQEIAEVAFDRIVERCLVDTTLTNRNLVPYYLTVVKNLAADEARAVRTAPILLAPDSLNCGVRLWAERIQDASELLDDLVIPAIRTMRPGQRRSVVEIQSQGADDTDISIALGIPRKQVQVQRVQAVKELRVKLRKSIRSRFHGGKEGAKPP